MFTSLWFYLSLGVGFILTLIIMLMFRTVVPTNDMHVVQSSKKTMSYGKDQPHGNVYYDWPACLPLIGIETIKLNVSVFNVSLDEYAAYDKGRVPFVVDIMAFFRITDPNLAAQRVLSQKELMSQLKSILQGSVRAILAQSEIEEILEGRGKFGEMFTQEVDTNLQQWGVQTVKCIELMDIRDTQGSQVIANIMAKKKSLIEMESRIEVAKNQQAAQEAEILAQQIVGQKSAEKEKQIGIAAEQAKQEIKEQAKLTAEKEMSIQKVNEVRQAEIERDVAVVAADKSKQTSIINAEGQKQQAILVADGNLEAAKRNAEGIKVEGEAKGAAEQALLMAPVNSQVTLAKEIGENQGYQTYLVSIRQIEAQQMVGIEQAKALSNADVKVISNTGDTISGVDKVMDLFSSKGGLAVGSMLESMSQTPVGKSVLDKFTNKENKPNGTSNGHTEPFDNH